jgi:PPK2 family polyphosphate:nucleotide phosphotransferase
MPKNGFAAVKSPYLVPFDGSFRVRKAPTSAGAGRPDKQRLERDLAAAVAEISELQRILYAHDYHSVLLIFQALDAAGKDSTIRAVLTGIDPSGCQVYSFKRPSLQELDHDFLWRTTLCLPERGRVGVFNRSYYEEVLAVRVHPEYLKFQKLPQLPKDLDDLWEERYESIREHEKHLARNGTLILKFWLNVSREEQRRRLLSRLDEPEKHWKFEAADIAERAHWKDYMRAYEDALNATSRACAPWYVIPADHKPSMRLAVARIVVQSLQRLGLRYPELDPQNRHKVAAMRRTLESEG